MTDEEIYQTFRRHILKYDAGDARHPYGWFTVLLDAQKEIIAEAVQKGIDEHVVTQKGYVFNIWEIEQRRKVLEEIEKGSIDFVKFLAKEFSDKRNDDQNPLSEIRDRDGFNIVYYYKEGNDDCLKPSLEQLYQEYIQSLNK